jgi:dienelactone hydrolase
MRTTALVLLLVGLMGRALGTQAFHFVYPIADAGSVTAKQDVKYGSAGGETLAMDVYRPTHPTASRLPAIVFFNRARGENRHYYFYSGWAERAAASGLVAILPDLGDETAPRDFGILLTYLTEHAAELGIQSDAIAVYAGSSNVGTALPVVEASNERRVRSAVMVYGTAPITEFRRDLPILFVRAGLDRPDVNRRITELASLGISQNAPVTLLNHSTGHHGFEIFDDTDATRQVIDRIIEFVKTTTASGYVAALKAGLPEATAAGLVMTGRTAEASAAYAQLVAARPDDRFLELAYGEALLGNAQYAEACAVFDTLRGKDLGPRDLGLPAARACMQKGDADAAIAWLKSIPSRFLPSELETDPAFAPLKGRAEFHALFR